MHITVGQLQRAGHVWGCRVLALGLNQVKPFSYSFGPLQCSIVKLTYVMTHQKKLINNLLYSYVCNFLLNDPGEVRWGDGEEEGEIEAVRGKEGGN